MGGATLTVREAGPVEPPRPRLLDRVRDSLRTRHYSQRTEDAYVAWIRVLERCHLRVQDIDFSGNQIVVRSGKGDKDRATMRPAMAKPDLARHLAAVRVQHQADLTAGAGWVELPTALLRKYPNAGR